MRLFRYAKASEAMALENFTTEALAAAVRNDASPIIRAFENCGLGSWVPFDVVETQVQVAGIGVFDLVLRSGAKTVVVEAKLGAPESGDQLTRYLAWIDAQSPSENAILVVLGPRRLTEDQRVHWLSWETLRKSIADSGTTHPYWTDFARFLVEIGMKDDSLDPITPAEARTLGPSFSLLRKLVRMLAQPASRLNAVWPGSNWPEGDNAIRKQLVNRFGAGNGFSIQHCTYFKAGIALGAYDWETDVWLGIWLWCDPRKIAERNKIYAQVQELATKPPWELDLPTWELLGAYVRLADISNADAGAAWFLARIEELEAAAVFSLLGNLGSAPAEPESEDPPGAAPEG